MIARFLAALVAVMAAGAARADAVADFYRGKQISLYVAFPPGGGYDIYARLFGPYFSKYIPGNPQILVKNMEGGSGVRAAAYITTATQQDGDRKSTRLNSSHIPLSRMPSSA